MQNTPLVSVIIPTYNRADLVSEAIDSVLAQTYKNIELIVVDDGSTDNTKERIMRYEDKLKYFYIENSGNANARNYGISKARGDYIAFLDHDDVWYPDRINTLVAFLEKNHDFGAMLSEVEFVDMKCNRLSCTNYSKDFPDNGDVLPYLLKKLLGLFSNLIVRKDVITRVGEIDEALKAASDIDYLFRIAVYYKIGLHSKPLMKYRKTDTSFSNNLYTKNRLRVFAKFEKLYPELALNHKKIIQNTLSNIHLCYAKDLMWHRYLKKSREQIYESFRYGITLKGISMYMKNKIICGLGLFLPKFKDKGKYGGEYKCI
jgi:glycosyltransferase involved in cell wall biosynthesis